MALLDSVKLVAAKRSANISPVQQRRNKLLRAIDEQIALATAVQSGTAYAPTKQKKTTDAATGERVVLTVKKRVKQWWWTGDKGKLQLCVRYGAKALALNTKGANAIELASTAEVIDTLQLVKQAVEAGELDAAIEAATAATRKQFK